jgi:hypothetical protein
MKRMLLALAAVTALVQPAHASLTEFQKDQAIQAGDIYAGMFPNFYGPLAIPLVKQSLVALAATFEVITADDIKEFTNIGMDEWKKRRLLNDEATN